MKRYWHVHFLRLAEGVHYHTMTADEIAQDICHNGKTKFNLTDSECRSMILEFVQFVAYGGDQCRIHTRRMEEQNGKSNS